MMTIESGDKGTRDINRAIKNAIKDGERDIRITKPGARHNLGVGLVDSVTLHFDGAVGYYCGGLIDKARLNIKGSAGWGVGESKMGGEIVIEGSAGNGAGAAMRGGMLVIKGDASARAGVSMKGGTLIIGGSCGYMTGFMAQKGRIVVCGDGGEALADSMYETEVFVGGEVPDLGNDAVIEDLTADDIAWLKTTLMTYGMDSARDWKKIVAGRRLWNFDKNDLLWREAL